MLVFCFYSVKKRHTVGVLPVTEHFSSMPVLAALGRVLLLSVEPFPDNNIMLS